MTFSVPGREIVSWARAGRDGRLVLPLFGFALLALLSVTAPEFLLLLAAALVVCIIGWIELRVLVYLAVFMIPWQIYMMNVPGSTYTFRLEDVIVGVATVLTLGRNPRAAKLLLTGWMAPILMFIAIAVGMGISQGDAYATGKFIADWWPTVALYWLLLAWKGEIDWAGLTGILLFSFCLEAGLGILQTAVGDQDFIISVLRSPMAEIFFDRDVLAARVAESSFNFFWRGRAYAFGTYLAATGFAVVLAGGAAIAWGLALGRKRTFQPALMWLAGTVLFCGCLLTLKRTGVLAALAGILTIVLSRQRGGLSALAGRLTVLVIAALLTLGLAHWKDAELGDRISDQSGSAYSREFILPMYLGLALMRPVFGYGPGYPMGSEKTGYWEGSDYDFGPENSYLHLTLTAGLLGLALFLFQFLYGLSRLWASPAASLGGEAQAISAGLAAFAIGGMFVVAVGDLKASGPPFFLLAWAHHLIGQGRTGEKHRVTS